MNARNTALIIFLLLSSTGCTFLYPSRTPEGVDISSISTLDIGKNTVELSEIVKHVPGRFWHKKYSYQETLVFHEPNNESKDGIFRSINIYQLNTELEALAKYKDLKSSSTDNSEDRIYKEKNTTQEKYIITYKAPRWDSNHGIPTHIYTKPDIDTIILKNNLIIVIAYTSHLEKDNNYIDTINKDILSVYELLKKSFRQPAELKVESNLSSHVLQST